MGLSERRISPVGRREMVRWLKFLLVGGIGTTLDFLALLFLWHRLGTPVLVAVAGGWATSVTAGYVLSRVFVFSDGQVDRVNSSWRYLTLVGFNAAIGVLGVAGLVSLGAPYLLTRVGSSTFLVIFNYVVSRAWVFGVPSRAEGVEAATPAPPARGS